MSLKIQCPHCARSHTLKPKPGRFKLACTACKQPFMLVVGEGDPPKHKVGKLPTKPADDATIDAGHIQKAATKPMGEELTMAATASQLTKPNDRSAAKSAAKSEDFSLATAPAEASRRSKTLSQTSSEMPHKLGGYRILSELGRGGMGSVYLAKQISLDRKVAVKTIQAAWASHPQTIARFIREAYAAAQLNHHNVVQIHDLGEDQGINFFSMEAIEGGSLQDLIQRSGKVDPQVAASYILQAARGLKFAHDHGMVHRDVKPANLLLGNDSLVKVADLGLVKTPEMPDDEEADEEERNAMLASARTQVTGAGSTMGTPAYMAPEQAEDAASVDHRADIYSLGCTFFALLTGHPPFVSQNPLELISQHKTQRVSRPDKEVVGVPAALGAIVEKMTARKPEDRYADLGETIVDLEQFLAGGTREPHALREADAGELKAAATQFASAPMAKIRNLLPWSFLAGCVLLALLCSLFSLRVTVACLVVPVMTPLFISGLTAMRTGSSPVGSRLRASLLGSALSDWITWVVVALFALFIGYALGLLGWWLAAIVLSALLAIVYQALVPGKLESQRAAALQTIDTQLGKRRLEGMEERKLQRWVAEHAGPHWEELFEQVFNYDAMRSARNALKADGKWKGRRRFQPWRDWLVGYLDKRIEQTRRVKETNVLAKLEQANLTARGLSVAQAKQQAHEMAATMVMTAQELRQPVLTPLSMESAQKKRERIKAMLQAARTGKPKSLGSVAKRTTGAILEHLLGWKLRFVVGGLLVLGCALWANQNGLLNKSKITELKNTATDLAQRDLTNTNLKDLGDTGAQLGKIGKNLVGSTVPWDFPVVGGWFTSFAPGLIGMFILASCLVSGWRYSLFALPAAAMVLLGESLGMPAIVVSAAWLSGLVALAILTAGLFLGSGTKQL